MNIAAFYIFIRRGMHGLFEAGSVDDNHSCCGFTQNDNGICKVTL